MVRLGAYAQSSKASMVKAGAMVFKIVVPRVPGNTKEQKLLEEDLHRIGCHGLMGKS